MAALPEGRRSQLPTVPASSGPALRTYLSRHSWRLLRPVRPLRPVRRSYIDGAFFGTTFPHLFSQTCAVPLIARAASASRPSL